MKLEIEFSSEDSMYSKSVNLTKLFTKIKLLCFQFSVNLDNNNIITVK